MTVGRTSWTDRALFNCSRLKTASLPGRFTEAELEGCSKIFTGEDFNGFLTLYEKYSSPIEILLPYSRSASDSLTNISVTFFFLFDFRWNLLPKQFYSKDAFSISPCNADSIKKASNPSYFWSFWEILKVSIEW